MKILIAGDSWGLGEWDQLPDPIGYDVSHPGLEYFLKQDKHEVKNISKGGNSPRLVYESGLKVETTVYDHVFVFVTDPHRDIISKDFWINGYTYKDYLKRHDDMIKQFIADLGDLDIGPVHLVGGYTRVNSTMLSNSKVDIAIPSVLNLLTKRQWDMCFRDHLHMLRDKKISDMVGKEVIGKVYDQEAIFDSLKGEHMMSSDGVHPDRHAHYEIYKELKRKYNM